MILRLAGAKRGMRKPRKPRPKQRTGGSTRAIDANAGPQPQAPKVRRPLRKTIALIVKVAGVLSAVARAI